MKFNDIDEYLGGLPKKSPHLIIGGYSANYAIGGMAVHQIRNNLLDWKLLSDETKRIQTINDILNLGQYVDDPKLLCAVIEEIYNLPNEDILKAMVKSLNLLEPLDIALRKLYYVWCDLMEFMLLTLLKLENITVIDFSLKDLKNIKTKSYKINEMIDKYDHKGYCPCEPIKRITNLFNFPMGEIVDEIKKIEPSFMIDIDLNRVYYDIEKIVKTIDNPPDDHIGLRTKFDNKGDLNDCMEQFIGLYKIMLPALQKQEEHYIEKSKKVLEICNIIEAVIMNLR